MARNHGSQSNDVGVIKRAARSVMRLFGRGGEHVAESSSGGSTPARREAAPAASTARPVRREADIPLDRLEQTYTPPATSSKASFRSDGSDHQTDQEFAFGAADERWNDEDHYTNKSGDPRIGTRGRTYEPGEKRTASASNEEEAR